MSESNSLRERWATFRPSKAIWFWSLAGAVVLTTVVGFTWGGWTTGGSAREMANSAAEDAQNNLVASACVERFLAAADAPTQLAALKAESSWKRGNMLEAGGWVTMAGFEGQPKSAARLCSDRLGDMELPLLNASSTGEEATIAQ